MPDCRAPPDRDEAALKRLATQLSVQLPTDYGEAVQVMTYLRDLVDWQADLVRPQRVNAPEMRDVLIAFPRPA